MIMQFDGESDVKENVCADCGRTFLLVTSFVLRDDRPYAMAKTALRDHCGQEAWVDAALGEFDEERRASHISFGCRVGPVEGSDEPGATAVDAAQMYPDAWLWGRKLTRDEALAHPRIQEFWSLVDFLLVNEPSIQHHVYHHATSNEEHEKGRSKVAWWQRRRDGRG